MVTGDSDLLHIEPYPYRRRMPPEPLPPVSGSMMPPEPVPLTATQTPGGGMIISHSPLNVMAGPVSTPATGFQFTGTQLLIGAAILYFLVSKK
jgi:hypothetical protein